jgi:hypothetical protein
MIRYWVLEELRIEDLWMSLAQCRRLRRVWRCLFYALFLRIDPAGFQLIERRTLNIQSSILFTGSVWLPAQ